MAEDRFEAVGCFVETIRKDSGVQTADIGSCVEAMAKTHTDYPVLEFREDQAPCEALSQTSFNHVLDESRMFDDGAEGDSGC